MDVLNTLLEISVYSAVIFLAVMLMKKLLGPRMSPALHYAAWALLVIRLMLPVTVDSGLRLFTLPQQSVPAQSAAAMTAGEAEPTAPLLEAAASSAAPAGPAGFETGGASAAEAMAPQPSALAVHGAANPANTLSAGNVLLAVWLTGVAAALTYIAVSYAVFRRQLRRDALPVSARVREIFGQCRQEMGIRRRVRLMGIRGLMTPAIFVPATVTVPMALAETMDDGQLRLALRHELTHYRRKDHIVSALLLLLQAVHWFNPFVWLAFRQLRADMEIACDSAVTRRLDGEAKSAYAGLIISLFSKGASGHLVLGMARGGSKKAAEKRIRGIFAKSRSKKSAVLISALLAAVLLVGCFTTACQPTPAEPIVQSKAGDAVQQAIASQAPEATAEIHRYSAPASWQGEVSDEAKKISIHVDAPVSVPTDTWNIYQLSTIEPDRAYLDRVLKTLVGGAPLYGADTHLGRDQLLKQLSQIETEIAAVRQQGVMPTPGKPGEQTSAEPVDNSDALAYLEQWKASVTEALKSAPEKETAVRVDIDTDMLFQKNTRVEAQSAGIWAVPSVNILNNGGVELSALADIGRIEPAHVYLSSGVSGMLSIRFQIGLGGNGGFGVREPLGEKPLAGVTISQDEAADIARQAVRDMGFDYMDIAAVQRMDLYNSNTGEQPDCFAFTFTRSLDSAMTTYAYGSGEAIAAEDLKAYDLQYARQWRTDEIVIGVDDSGVICADINVPQSGVTQLAQGVELKDFGEIMEIFNRQAIIEGCWSPFASDERAIGQEIWVDEIRLGYMPTIWKDHPDEIIFVPVWDFFGSEVISFDKNAKTKGDLYEALDENHQLTEDLGSQAILTINAMDGTIMRRMYGYG
jgi:beta-lactamase regulating signal transducer with metallopeptidase domain